MKFGRLCSIVSLMLSFPFGLLLHAQAKSPSPVPRVRPARVFVGTIETEDKAASGTITFTVARNGAVLKKVAVYLTKVKYDGGVAKQAEIEMSADASIKIQDGKFSGDVEAWFKTSIDGTMVSATEAEGTIAMHRVELEKETPQTIRLTDERGATMRFTLPAKMYQDLGVMKWRAVLKTPTPKKSGLELLMQQRTP